MSIHLKQAEGAIGSSAITSVKEFANVYLDGPTIHLALPLVAAYWAILRGGRNRTTWHHSLLLAGTVLLYTPMGESAVEVCQFHFSQAYDHACNSVE